VTDERGGRSIERWVGLATAIVAPVTVLSALLFYFGYVSTRATYEYFGIDVDAVGLSTQDYLMRSPRPLLTPFIGLLLLGILALWLHVNVRGLVAAGGRRRSRVRVAARWTRVAGVVILVTGILLVLVYPRFENRAVLDLLIPLCLAVGIVLLAYGSHVTTMSDARANPNAGDTNGPSWRPSRAVASVLVIAVVTANVFWATATLAQWSGRGQAVDLSRRLDSLPSVILDTKERLYVRDPVIDEAVLPSEDGQEFRYRYRQLRLLVHGSDRMFLVPAEWSPSGTTLLVPLNENVRVRFQFQNPG
jgi:hypothetical protein